MLPKLPALMLAATLGLAAAVGPRDAEAAEYLLRFASINAEGTAVYEPVFKPFAEAVNRDSDGRIEVALKQIGGYGKPTDLFNMVERGDIGITSTVQGYMSTWWGSGRHCFITCRWPASGPPDAGR